MADVIREGTDSTWLLAVDQTITGFIDDEPIAGDGETSDGFGGYVDKDWYRVTLLSGHTYRFSATAGVSSSDTLNAVAIRLYNSSGSAVTTVRDAASPTLDYSGAGGIYYIAVSAGGTGSWQTKTGSFRISLTDTTPAGLPDLIMSSVKVGTQTMAQGDVVSKLYTGGDTFTATIDIKNNGNADAVSSESAIYLGNSNGFKDSNSTTALAAGATDTSETLSFALPYGLSYGRHTILLAVDRLGEVVESNESNNATAFYVDVFDDYAENLGETDTIHGIWGGSVGTPRSGVIGAADTNDDALGDRDAFIFNLQGGHTYTITATGANGLANAVFTLRNSSFQQIGPLSSEGSQATLTYEVPTSGNYFVRVGTASAGQTGTYTLLVTDNGASSTPPVITIQAASSYAAGTILRGDQLISVSDPQGPSDIKDILIYDAIDAAGAEWRLNGGLINPGGGSNPAIVPYSQLSLLTYKVGTAQDTFSFEAVDLANAKSAEALHTISVVEPTGNSRPQIAGPSLLTLGAGVTDNFGQRFTISDANGSSDLARVEFRDSTPTAGQLTFQGSAVSSGVLSILPSQLGDVRYVAGAAGSTDALSVTVFDQAGTSTKLQVGVDVGTSGPAAPVITGPGVLTLGILGEVRLSASIDMTDPNGIADIDRIILHDATKGTDGGAFYIGSQKLALGLTTLTYAQFEQLSYRGGANSGSNSIILEAIDKGGLSRELSVQLTVSNLALPDIQSPSTSALSIVQYLDQIENKLSFAWNLTKSAWSTLKALDVLDRLMDLPSDFGSFKYRNYVDIDRPGELLSATFGLDISSGIELKRYIVSTGESIVSFVPFDEFRAEFPRFLDGLMSSVDAAIAAAQSLQTMVEAATGQSDQAQVNADVTKIISALAAAAAISAGVALIGVAATTLGVPAMIVTGGGLVLTVVGNFVAQNHIEKLLTPYVGWGVDILESNVDAIVGGINNPELYLGAGHQSESLAGRAVISVGKFVHYVGDRLAPFFQGIEDSLEGKNAVIDLGDLSATEVEVATGQAVLVPGPDGKTLYPVSFKTAGSTPAVSSEYALSNFADLTINGPSSSHVTWGFSNTSETSLSPNTIHLNLGAGVDTVNANDADKRIVAGLGDGHDVFNGGVGNDRVVGGIGNDMLNGGTGADALFGDFETNNATPGDDTIDGGDGDDFLVGGKGNDVVRGGAGNDIILNGNSESAELNQYGLWNYGYRSDQDGGNDSIDGGPSLDTAIVVLIRPESIFLDARDPSAINPIRAGAVQIGTITGIEQLKFYGGPGNDVITGVDLPTEAGSGDYLEGREGNDILSGMDGSDLLSGGPGDDELHGGAGIDRADYYSSGQGGSPSTAGVTVDLTLQGTPQQTGGAGRDILTGIEDITGTKLNDFLRGNGEANHLQGTDGDDIIHGGGGNDRIDGFAGNHQFFGEGGNDILDGFSGNDLLDGGPGDDILNGGSDEDVARFAGPRANYAIVSIAAGHLQVTSALEGTDQLHDIEILRFADGDFRWNGSALVAASTAASDFDGNGRGDILWRNTNGQLTNWLSTASGFVPNGASTTVVSTDWKVAGTDDFDGDGKADILWRNDNGFVTSWRSKGALFDPGSFNEAVATNWAVAGTGDFNGDGKADIMWRNTSGYATQWLSNGNGFIIAGQPMLAVDTGWKIKGLGDFNGDGKDDILWRNDSGHVTQWLSSGNDFSGAGQPGIQVDNSWSVAGLGDFNGDGKDDILWRNVNGTLTRWLGAGNGFDGAGQPMLGVGLEWTVAGVRDINGDAKDDIVWRNVNGSVTQWLSTGPSFDWAGQPFYSVSNDWSIVG